MAISTVALWDVRISMWMDAEMDGFKDRENGILVIEPLMEVAMEEKLAPAPTIVRMEDCTDGKE